MGRSEPLVQQVVRESDQASFQLRSNDDASIRSPQNQMSCLTPEACKEAVAEWEDTADMAAAVQPAAGERLSTPQRPVRRAARACPEKEPGTTGTTMGRILLSSK